MATFPSKAGFEVVGGGTPTAEEVAAIAAALDALLFDVPPPPSPSRWRWSGRWWAEDALTDWRRSPSAAHPSRP